MEKRQELSDKSSDLWYTLHEDYVSYKKFIDDFITYLNVQVSLLKLLNDTERLDIKSAIAHNDTNGRNIAYSLLTTLSVARDQFPKDALKDLNTLLVSTVDVFSVPNNQAFWDSFYVSINNFLTASNK